MLTYQFQDRVVVLDGDAEAVFPNTIRVEVQLGPPQVFGAAAGLSLLWVHGSANTVTYHGHTGRVDFEADPPLEPLSVSADSGNERIRLAGDRLRYERHCVDYDDLVSSLHALQFAIPALLNLTFPEPPVVLGIGGYIGDAGFQWIHERSTIELVPMTKDGLESDVRTALVRTGVATPIANRRLLAPLSYLHEASRLRAAGVTEWEFMPGCILALCKVLEVLFGNTRDAVRSGLAELGYSATEIEGDFIPLLLLRNHLDVAHARLAVIKHAQLNAVYAYLRRAERLVKDLVARVLAGVEGGTYTPLAPGTLELSTDEQRRLDGVVAAINDRLVVVREDAA